MIFLNYVLHNPSCQLGNMIGTKMFFQERKKQKKEITLSRTGLIVLCFIRIRKSSVMQGR